MNLSQIWAALSKNQQALAGLAALLVVSSTTFGVIKSVQPKVEPYLPAPLHEAIVTERRDRMAADDSLRAALQRVLDGEVALLGGQRELVNALGLAVDVIADPRSPEADEARRKLRRMHTRRFDPQEKP